VTITNALTPSVRRKIIDAIRAAFSADWQRHELAEVAYASARSLGIRLSPAQTANVVAEAVPAWSL
jgi:hypothetical protein